jgi:hypothetical protein
MCLSLNQNNNIITPPRCLAFAFDFAFDLAFDFAFDLAFDGAFDFAFALPYSALLLQPPPPPPLPFRHFPHNGTKANVPGFFIDNNSMSHYIVILHALHIIIFSLQ